MSEMRRRMDAMEARTEELRKRLNRFPVRWPVGGGLLNIQPLVIRTVEVDHLITRSFDYTNVGDTDILVALPWLLRRTPFDLIAIAGITYTYTTNIERVADDTVTTETQVIVPNYQGPSSPPPYDGDVIYAVAGISRGTGVTVSGQPLELIDLNLDGRAWARKFE